MTVTYRVDVLPIAFKDMENIVAYVSEDLGSPVAAERLARKLVEAMRSLAALPTRCPLYMSPKPLKHEYRKLVVGSYLMLFWVSEEQKVVTVARVLYGGRDLKRLLR